MEQTNIGGTTLTIDWAETELGVNSTLGCPCGNVNTSEINRQATRQCSGSYSGVVDWITPYDIACQFESTALALCEASLVSGKHVNMDYYIEVGLWPLSQRFFL